jgi:hypothetical protein
MSDFARRALDEYPPDSSRVQLPCAPDFVPRQYVSTTGPANTISHAFAVCGYKLFLGSHVLRMYDLLALGDAQPVITFDPRSMGLETQGKR